MSDNDTTDHTTKCIYRDCTERAKTRGYCPKHYQRLLRHGDPGIVHTTGRKPRPILPDGDRCIVNDCDKPIFSRGWCVKHYHRMRRHGSVDAVHTGGRPIIRDYHARDMCIGDNETCVNLAVKSGLCHRHLNEYRFCLEPGCPELHMPKEPYCIAHHRGDLCISFIEFAGPCGNLAYKNGMCRTHYAKHHEQDSYHRRAKIMDEIRKGR